MIRKEDATKSSLLIVNIILRKCVLTFKLYRILGRYLSENGKLINPITPNNINNTIDR